MRPLLWSFEGARASDSAAARLTTWAVIAAGKHLFPFRTEKLSPLAPMVLGEQSPGRVGRRPLAQRARGRALFSWTYAARSLLRHSGSRARSWATRSAGGGWLPKSAARPDSSNGFVV